MNNFQKPIAVGRTAEVFPFEDGKVLNYSFQPSPNHGLTKKWIPVDIFRMHNYLFPKFTKI